jgi:hypothetical protein
MRRTMEGALLVLAFSVLNTGLSAAQDRADQDNPSHIPLHNRSQTGPKPFQGLGVRERTTCGQSPRESAFFDRRFSLHKSAPVIEHSSNASSQNLPEAPRGRVDYRCKGLKTRPADQLARL